MVVHVVAERPAEMWFVQRDDVVEDLSPATSDPSLRDSILPRCLYARPFALQSRCLQERDHLVVECRIAIEDHIPIRTPSGKPSRSCWTTQSAVGWRVTLKCRILRRPCSITKQQ